MEKRIPFIILFVFVASFIHSQNKITRLPDWLSELKMEARVGSAGLENQEIYTKVIPGGKAPSDLLGTTWYDLQSNYSLENRLYAYDDGTMGYTWMRAFESTSYPDRGTGYNYFNGTQWGPDPTSIIETLRTGWPCYAPYGPGGEIIVSHSFSQMVGLVFSRRNIKGQGSWEQFTLKGPSGYDIVHPAMITSGTDRNTIHVLAATFGPSYQGMVAALLYYRSPDGGQTWDIQHKLIDGIGSESFTEVIRNAYAWAEPKGDTLAFSVGFAEEDGIIMKSYDNGNTWQKIQVYESPFAPYTGGNTPAFGAGDGTQAIALDKDGNAHMVFGRMKYTYDQNTLFYYPGTEGLIYWHEGMPVIDSTIVSSYTLDLLEQGGNLAGYMVPFAGDSTVSGFGLYYTSLTSHPQINITQDDNILVIWSGVAPGFKMDDKNYRHVFANSSTDGGLSWRGVTDLTSGEEFVSAECVYPSMAPRFTNGKAHIAFQTDGMPGINVFTSEHPPLQNNMVYLNIGMADFLGLTEGLNKKLPAITAYPNPFRNYLTIKVVLQEPSEVTIKLSDLMGNLVYINGPEEAQKGERTLKINGESLPVGFYFYTVILNGQVTTGKLVKR